VPCDAGMRSDGRLRPDDQPWRIQRRRTLHRAGDESAQICRNSLASVVLRQYSESGWWTVCVSTPVARVVASRVMWMTRRKVSQSLPMATQLRRSRSSPAEHSLVRRDGVSQPKEPSAICRQDGVIAHVFGGILARPERWVCAAANLRLGDTRAKGRRFARRRPIDPSPRIGKVA
jgi:hypothetical protein